jgi:kumamolisin
VQVGVAIASPKEAEEAAFAKALYTAGSPDFHHFLTPSQRAARFGVDVATVGRVRGAVTADGLSVAYSAPDGTYVLLAGTVGQVERTFSVTEEDHRGLDGTMFRANGNAPTVPLGVNAVLGLSSIGMTRSQDVLYRRWSSAR